MTPMDCFALLGEPRRPWVDVDALKTRFLRLSAEVHPDRVHDAPEAVRTEAGRRYTEVNSAYQVVRDPRQRLLHLLELEGGARPKDIQRIPPGTMELFVEIGQACREVDAFLARRRSVASPMLRVRLFQEGLEWTGRLQALQGRLQDGRAVIDGELRGLNAAWEAAAPVGADGRGAGLPLGRLEDHYRSLSYLARWTEQIQERLVQLAAP